MVEEVTVTGISVTGALVIDHLQDDTEAHQEEHHQGLAGTEGGAEVCHAAHQLIETVQGEVATAGVHYVVVRLLVGNQVHMVVVHGRSPGAGASLGQDQGPHHLCRIAPPLPPHLRNVQVTIGPGLCRSVLKGRRVWFPMEMAPLILLGSRGKKKGLTSCFPCCFSALLKCYICDSR